jgi:hypothetical protein
LDLVEEEAGAPPSRICRRHDVGREGRGRELSALGRERREGAADLVGGRGGRGEEAWWEVGDMVCGVRGEPGEF